MTHDTGLIFLGPPGAGKGTQAKLLAEAIDVPHIAIGDILREAIADQTPIGKEFQQYVDRGELVPDRLILDLINDRIQQPDAKKGWILDGFPRNVKQALFLEELLAKLDRSYTIYVVNLEVPEQVLMERLLERGRKDDTPETLSRRLQVHKEATEPVIDFYRDRNKLYSIDGDRSQEEVTKSIEQIVTPAQSGI
ncbi:MAG: adenylate kinase [Prochloraceae cyanobacterium]|nr:adenylate kinase [Prochloraceae cyanobacterium]